MNDSGSWRNVSVAISVSSLRVTSAKAIDSEANGADTRAATPIRPATPSTPLEKLAPASRAIPTMMSDWITIVIVCWTTRPASSAGRLIGDTSRRSVTPRSRSSSRPMPVQPAEKNAVMITMPGARNSM
jgi:hypothetical protein